MNSQESKPAAEPDVTNGADGRGHAAPEPAPAAIGESAGLRAELEQAQAKAEENWNRYLSARAELDNLRKRAERDLVNAHKFALEKFIAELLPVKDSLELGISAATDNGQVDVEKLKEGKELTLKMLAAALAKVGVQELDPRGEKFNPEFHAAIALQPSTEAAPNTVLQVIQKGYVLNDRLVRPALVIVAQTPPATATTIN